jgi:hypothetical protein
LCKWNSTTNSNNFSATLNNPVSSLVSFHVSFIDSAIRKAAEAEIKRLRDLDPVSSIICHLNLSAEKIPWYSHKRSGR